jgi:hypothetical protein
MICNLKITLYILNISIGNTESTKMIQNKLIEFSHNLCNASC